MISLSLIENHLDLKLLKQVWIAIAGRVLVIMLADFGWGILGNRPRLAISQTFDASSYSIKTKPLENYESAFQTGGLLGTANPAGLAVLKSSIGELAKDYRLQGVVILDKPEAILQDARTQKTIFVKTGESLGELTVKEIREGSIVLTCYGEDATIKIE